MCLHQNYKKNLSRHTLALAGWILLTKGTTSPSADFIPTISCCSVKERRLMPSKHFFKWGWTLNGSLVSDKISSSSSFERKKNLEEKITIIRHDIPNQIMDYIKSSACNDRLASLRYTNLLLDLDYKFALLTVQPGNIPGEEEAFFL